jgi:DNA repair exonuclease SbcCD nuclease subunit
MKIAIVTDIHIGARGDSRVFHEVQRKFFQEVFFPYIDEHGITTVFDLGDTFDRRKYINYVSLQRGKEFLFDELAKRNIDFHALIGNHDTYYSNMNDVNSMDLLLKEYPSFKLYQDKAEHLTLGSTKFLMLPWISKENAEYNMKMVQESDANIIMGHLEVKGFEMMKGSLCTHGLDMSVFKNFESVYSGHFHHPSRYGNVEYLGAPYEMTWSDYNGARGFHVFDTETREMKKILNPYRVFFKVDYDDESWTIDDVASFDVDRYKDTFVKVIVKNRTNAYLYDMFMNRLSECGAVDVKAIDDNLNLESAGVDEILDETKDTTEILHNYIDSLDTSVEKSKIKRVVDELYSEALSL